MMWAIIDLDDGFSLAESFSSSQPMLIVNLKGFVEQYPFLFVKDASREMCA